MSRIVYVGVLLFLPSLAGALPPPPISGPSGGAITCVTATGDQTFQESGLLSEANYLRRDVISQCEQAGGSESECSSRARCTSLRG